MAGCVCEQVFTFQPTQPGFGQTQSENRDILQNRIRLSTTAKREAKATTRAKHLPTTDRKIIRDRDGDIRVYGVSGELQAHGLPKVSVGVEQPVNFPLGQF